MVPLAVGVSLVGLEWPTVTAVVMVIMNATKITDRQTVQTEVLSVWTADLCAGLSVSWTVTVTY